MAAIRWPWCAAPGRWMPSHLALTAQAMPDAGIPVRVGGAVAPVSQGHLIL
jgi:hypothetical protein